MRILVSLLILGGFLLGSGCQSDPDSVEAPPQVPPGTAAEATPTPGPVSSPQGDVQLTPSMATPPDASLQNLIERIKEDLAGRLALSVTAIEVAEVMEVEWSDSSLDCPQPGMDYLQVITPGYRIVLQVNNQSYEYHTNRDTYFVYCGDQAPPGNPGP